MGVSTKITQIHTDGGYAITGNKGKSDRINLQEIFGANKDGLKELLREVLQKGLVQKLSVTPEQAAKAVQGVVNEVQVGTAWLAKQGEWKVPLLYKGAIVAEMGVHGQDGSILPDWKASKDVTMYGRLLFPISTS